MTTPRRGSYKLVVLSASISLLIGSHFATQDSSAAWTRTLPLLLMLILGELVREATAERLAPVVDERAARRRRQLQWLTLIAGFVFLALPVGGISDPLPVEKQILIIHAGTGGHLDDVRLRRQLLASQRSLRRVGAAGDSARAMAAAVRSLSPVNI